MEQQKVLKTTSAAPMAFTEGVIWKQMLAFLVPIMLGAFVQQMYNTVDSMIVGRFLGLEALAAVGGSTSTLTTLLINFFAGLSSGASVVIAQDFGGGDRTRLTRSVQTAMLLGLFGGLVLMAGGLLLCGQVLAWMEVKDSVMPLALRYLEIYLWGMVPTAVYNMGAAALNAIGRSRSSFAFLAVACVVNILLDLLMVGVLDLGIGGAAPAGDAGSEDMAAGCADPGQDRPHRDARRAPKRIIQYLQHGCPGGHQPVLRVLCGGLHCL